MLDVGQGAAIALRDGRRVPVLFDAGPPGQPSPVLDALDRMGADAVGAMVISHAARDHLGGATAVMDRLPVRAVVLPQADRSDPAVAAVARHARARGITVQWAMRGTQVDAGPWRARVIGPVPAMERAGDANLRSLVLHVTAPGISAVLPADAESPALAGADLRRSDVLQVAHHGSADPGLDAVLDRVRPAIALVSAGRGNPYGHPRPSVLGAIAASGAAALRTDRGGDIDVRPGPSGIVVSRG
jgi:competence protein ComEC